MFAFAFYHSGGKPGARRRRGTSVWIRWSDSANQQHGAVINCVSAVERRCRAGFIHQLPSDEEVAIWIKVDRFRIEWRRLQRTAHSGRYGFIAAEQRQDDL